ncbi:MAG: hypothetical protein L0228_16180 [Planctomycetes bacterium]|nr:hypothetical protein [Planctomycetota bacterium]
MCQIFCDEPYVAVVITAIGITYFWWHRKVRVCDQGIVVRHKFAPWSDCRRWYWDACYRDVIVAEFQKSGRMAMKVPGADRAAVEALLQATA